MKIVIISNNYPTESGQNIDPYSGKRGWYLLADSAITNTGKPFFKPDNQGRVKVALGMAVKISRLGKHISEKFAPRYYSEWAPVMLFQLPNKEEALIKEGLPVDPARNFDRALFVGDFIPLEESVNFYLLKNKDSVLSFNSLDMIDGIDKIIRDVSLLNTLRIGDILVPAVTSGVFVDEEDFFEVMKGEERLFHVKVK